ncbi:TetR family transcriptional regulator [Bosea sp. WAO]|uniref:TetR family transcriptional regulator n=1 Tax=Bosea sp. WAO TaxID=406341 RepID=UPI00074766F1|nr:TetR family transcriptional regulator [Bosea sp. WAO]KUL95403.1 TetR family transcriptional regulator [Bosea sp. WAO]
MARKPASPKAESAAAKPAAPKPDPRRAVVDALFRLAANRSWDEIELPDIAREAGLSLAEMRGLFPSKLAILGGLGRIADDAVLAGNSDDLMEESYKERVFDLVMRRLDALAPYKAGLRTVMPALRRDPLALAALGRNAVNSWRYMLASAGIRTEDSLGGVRVRGAVLLMSRVAETWLEDDEPELSRTMAKLDRELKSAGRIMARVEDVHRLTAPLRGLARALCGGTRESRRERLRNEDGDGYAAAI